MKITFLTFNEPVNGVYISQVIEVVKFLSTNGLDIGIFAISSTRNYNKNKKLIKNNVKNSIVVPAFPGLKYWRINRFLLRLFSHKINKSHLIICRGPLATNLALESNLKPQVVYDGRGAVWAEQKEYGVFNGTGIEHLLFEIEKKAVLNSQKQIAVSSQLIKYWEETFNFNSNTAKVIPCSINEKKDNDDDNNIPMNIKNFLLNAQKNNSPIVVFSGGTGKWQKIDAICHFADKMIKTQPNTAFLFLSPQNSHINQLLEKYPQKVFNSLVAPKLVHSILKECDYGIVLREQNITNKVASPVKVAEYLLAGLKVIISPNLGDYSQMVMQNDLGVIWSANSPMPDLNKPSEQEKAKSNRFAKEHLSKTVIQRLFA